MKSPSRKSAAPVVLAIAAHPDDIEFRMAGTLLLLQQASCETHYLNIANGSCGSVEHDAKTTRKIRAGEARRAAKLLGAHFHTSLTEDMEIFYDLKTLRRLAAVVRDVKPSIVLTHPPQDYMEDHMNACRLAVTAAFAHGMPNFKTIPARQTYNSDVTVYHCLPHGFADGLRRRIVPGSFVNTASVQARKLAALTEHHSQQNWLDASQGINSYLAAMDEMSRIVGKMSRRFLHAEGWLRHLHWGFAARETDPLAALLGKKYLINQAYERELNKSPYAP